MFVSGGLYTVIAWQGFRKLSGEFELDETMFGGHRLGKRGLGVEGKHIVLDGEHILHRRIRRIHWISGQRKAHTRKEGKRAKPTTEARIKRLGGLLELRQKTGSTTTGEYCKNTSIDRQITNNGVRFGIQVLCITMYYLM